VYVASTPLLLLLLLLLLQGVEQYRLPVLASDVQQAVNALGHSSCTLVAHDWGGLVAWAVAGMYGKQV
jgi:pimeloyl-ACP methyl ester carboxylesterase